MGEDGDHDAGGAGIAERTGRFAAGAAGGQNIIDEEGGAAAENGARAGAEGAANVRLPSRRSLQGLQGSVPDAAQPGRPAGQAETASYRAGERFALVVAPEPAPPPVERDRDHDVRAEVPESGLGVAGPEIAHDIGQRFARSLLHPKDQVTQQSFVWSQPNRTVEVEMRFSATGTSTLEMGVRPY
jgi:hypothetical protein